MLHTERDQKIVKLRFVDGRSVREVASDLSLKKSAVQRAAARFRDDVRIASGLEPDSMPPDDLRSVVLVLLDRAAAVRGNKPVVVAEEIPAHRELLTVI